VLRAPAGNAMFLWLVSGATNSTPEAITNGACKDWYLVYSFRQDAVSESSYSPRFSVIEVI
jgi:hypothetical protein